METQTILVFVLCIVCIYILLHTYYYLQQIESCECFTKDNVKYGVNLEYMKFFQILHIILFVLYVAWEFMKIPIIDSKYATSFITTMLLILLLGVYGYMFYNIFNFYRNVKSDCKCVEPKFYKYFIYFEGVSSFMSLLQIIYSFALILIIITFQSKSHSR